MVTEEQIVWNEWDELYMRDAYSLLRTWIERAENHVDSDPISIESYLISIEEQAIAMKEIVQRGRSGWHDGADLSYIAACAPELLEPATKLTVVR